MSDNNGAKRYDQGKVRLELLDAEFIEEFAEVLTFGAKKYAANNWRKGMNYSRAFGSLKRHLSALERGEDFDQETGLHHGAHIACNAMFLYYYQKYNRGVDDRCVQGELPKEADESN